MKKQVSDLLSSRKTKVQQTDLVKQNKLLLSQIETLQNQLEFKKSFNVSPSTMQVSSSGEISESTAFAVLSDIHFEENVKSESVMGLNEFNVAIAKQRLNQFFYRVAKMLKKEQMQTKIDTLCLAILGDLISNYIHEELMESNEMPPSEALLECINEIAGGIRYLLKNSDVKLDIVCMTGNHGRSTKRVHVSNESGNSIEFIAYHFLAKVFIKEKRVKFSIPKSYLCYYQAKGFVVAFHHGHFVKFQGGIGGLTIPINKAIAQWQKLRHADLYVSGHFHQFVDGGNFIVNGSIIGYNAYALSIKAGFEKPKQVFFLVNHKYNCKTIVAPILFDI